MDIFCASLEGGGGWLEDDLAVMNWECSAAGDTGDVSVEECVDLFGDLPLDLFAFLCVPPVFQPLSWSFWRAAVCARASVSR